MRHVRHVAVVAAFALAGGGAVAAPALTAAAATTYYVQNQLSICSDTGSGTRSHPFCSLQAAADTAGPGATVRVINTGNPYRATTLNRSGAPGAPISFVGDEDPHARPVLSSSAAAPLLRLSGVHDVVVTGLALVETANQPAVKVAGSQRVSLTSLSVHLSPAIEPAAGTGAAAIDVDGASSDVSVTRSRLRSTSGAPTITGRKGARAITVATNVFPALFTGGAVALDGTTGAAVTGNSISGVACTPMISITGGGTATVKNNVVNSRAASSCPRGAAAAIGVGSGSAVGVHADYNAVQAAAPASEYLWKGTAYSTVASFRAATGQGAHDIEQARAWGMGYPAEDSPLVDSADNSASGATGGDLTGAPRVDDPLVPDTGKGSGSADRGAYELQDTLGLAHDVTPTQGIGSLTSTVTITSGTLSRWQLPITFSVDFGDGGVPVPVKAGASVTHTYAAPGRYELTTTGRTTAGAQPSIGQALAVGTPTAPTASFTVVRTTAGSPSMPAAANFLVTPNAPAWAVSRYSVAWGDGDTSSVGAGRTSHVFARLGTFTPTLTVTDIVGRTTSTRTTVTVGAAYYPVDPLRVVDRRVAAGRSVTLSLKDLLAEASAVDGVVVNVTVSKPRRTGAVSVVPAGTTPRRTTTLSFGAGQTVATLVSVPQAGGKVTVTNRSSGTATLAVDTVGFLTHGFGSHNYQPLPAATILDTRTGLGARKGALGAHRTLSLQVAGKGGVPADASIVALDLTTTHAKAVGSLVAYQNGTPRPSVTSLSWSAKRAASNVVLVPVVGGKVILSNQSAGTVDVLGSVVGYFTFVGPGSFLIPTTPQRLLDTSTGVGTKRARLRPGGSLKLHIGGRSGRPAAGVTAANISVTAFHAARGSGSVAAYPDGGSAARSSSLAYSAGRASSRLLMVPVGSNGAVALVNNGKTAVDVAVDLDGYFVAPPGS